MTMINPTFRFATEKWLSEPEGFSTLVLKPGIKALDWAKLYQGSLSNEAQASRKVLSHAKYGIKIVDLPRKCRNFIQSIYAVDFSQSPIDVTEKSIFVFKNGSSLARIAASGGEILHSEGLIALTVSQLALLKLVGTFGCCATILKSLVDVKKITLRLVESKEGSENRNYDLIQLVGKICILIGASLAMIAFILGGQIVAKGVILALSTASLALSISKYYYKELVLN